MEKSMVAGGVVLNSRGEVALAQSFFAGFWGFPKGHVEEGEDVLSAARREIMEETGLRDLTLVRELGTYERRGGFKMKEHKVIHMYLFSTKEVALAPIDPENPAAKWVPIDEVEGMLTNEKDRDFFVSIRSLLT